MKMPRYCSKCIATRYEGGPTDLWNAHSNRRASPAFDAGFLRQRCPKLDVGNDAFTEFLGGDPLRFEADIGEALTDRGFSQQSRRRTRDVDSDRAVSWS